jgi:hypothetical protein
MATIEAVEINCSSHVHEEPPHRTKSAEVRSQWIVASISQKIHALLSLVAVK